MTESDRTPRIPLQNMTAACLFQHQHPTVLSGKGRISQAQRKKSFSSWFMARGGPGTRCRLETVLSPVLLSGGWGGGGRYEVAPKSPFLLSPNGVQLSAQVPGESALAQAL